jgi:hypothetical protein
MNYRETDHNMIQGQCRWCGKPGPHSTKDECIAAYRDREADRELKAESLSLMDKRGHDYGGAATPEREAAISRFIADDARKLPLVVNFRRTVLKGRLLKQDGQVIAEWIQGQKQRDRGSMNEITVLLPKGRSLKTAQTGPGKAWGMVVSPPLIIPRDAPIIQVSSISLSFPGTGLYASSDLIPHGGHLDDLRQLSDTLSHRYGWGQAEAVAFVLADWTPVVRQLSVTFKRSTVTPLLNRIHMSVDPAVSPKELQVIYRTVRRQRAGRARDITDKKMRRAAFCAGRPTGETYAVMMLAWNKARPNKERYGQVSNFGRDARDAVKTVLGIDFKAQKGATK